MNGTIFYRTGSGELEGQEEHAIGVNYEISRVRETHGVASDVVWKSLLFGERARAHGTR